MTFGIGWKGHPRFFKWMFQFRPGGLRDSGICNGDSNSATDCMYELAFQENLNAGLSRENFNLPHGKWAPVWIEDFPFWWDRNAFFKKYNPREIDTMNPTYVDYGLLLTGSEAIEWNRRCIEQFSIDPRSKETYFFEAVKNLEQLLRSASWVIVESYEWESGLS